MRAWSQAAIQMWQCQFEKNERVQMPYSSALIRILYLDMNLRSYRRAPMYCNNPVSTTSCMAASVAMCIGFVIQKLDLRSNTLGIMVFVEKHKQI